MSCPNQCQHETCKELVEPESYTTIMAYEHKRFMSALDEASESIVQASLDPDNPDCDTQHYDHIDRARTIHAITKSITSIFWDDYILTGFGEMLSLHSINQYNEIVPKKPDKRSQLETYTSSLRALLLKSQNSFIMNVLFPSLNLTGLSAAVAKLQVVIREFLKYLESTISALEVYMTWIEHGSKLAAAFVNANTPDTVIYNDEEIETEPSEPYEFYNDIRVKAYAILKMTDFDSTKMVSCINSVSGLIDTLNEVITIIQKLYVGLDTQAFENIFNAAVVKKMKSPNYDGTKFANVHELNEYIRQRTRDSLEEPYGFMYNVNELLTETHSLYIDKLATEVIEALSFLPDEKSQRIFVKQFESGKIWPKVLE